MDKDKCIGYVYAVTGSKTTVILNDDLETLTRNYKGEVYNIGQIGSYVIIPEGTKQIIGMVFQIKMTELGDKLSEEGDISLPPDKKILELQLLGSIQDNKFERGISSYPNVKSLVYMTDKDDLEKIFYQYHEHYFSIGDIAVFEGKRCFLDPNAFFSKHIAVLGSTGSGKSCTVASILQKACSCEYARIIIFDLHNEYAAAFPEGSCLHTPDFEIPYWLMNFEELQSVFVDQNEVTAHNQIMVFREEVLKSKKECNPDLADVLTVDTPLYFDINTIYKRVVQLDKEMVPGSRGDKQGPLYGKLTRFALRLESKLNDNRYSFIFKPKTFTSSFTFKQLLSKLFGVESNSKIIILDLSGIPSDVRDAIVSLLSRTIFDFNFWNESRQDYPILIVYEEAHSYLPQSGHSLFKASRKAVERIAKEGRKYGVSAMIVSQRPSEVSETIVSQCNNFINLRLTNPTDQSYVKKLVPDALSNLIDVLPSLRQGEAEVLPKNETVIMRGLERR
ncbi:MAG: ATP-binding protein, partial [Deltaproteobacteria bacterium]|nr:ATP-binding protein [Deltaproteobacteria bacterium]MDI6880869.1 ATP-binding protein [Desulfitobacteriaceae bacterium]